MTWHGRIGSGKLREFAFLYEPTYIEFLPPFASDASTIQKDNKRKQKKKLKWYQTREKERHTDKKSVNEKETFFTISLVLFASFFLLFSQLPLNSNSKITYLSLILEIVFLWNWWSFDFDFFFFFEKTSFSWRSAMWRATAIEEYLMLYCCFADT